MSLFDGDLWIVAVVGVFVIALVAKWLRGAAVEDPHEEMRDFEKDERLAAADEREPDAEAVDDSDVGPEEEEEEEEDDGDEVAADDEDEMAPLGVSPDDRLEFLERLAERGAVALLWTPRQDSAKGPRFVQHRNPDDTIRMPVFTSSEKAYRYRRMRSPKARALVSSIETMLVDAAFLVEGDFEVVVNPGTPFETTLTAEDCSALAALAGVEEREPEEPTVTDEEIADLEARYAKESAPSES